MWLPRGLAGEELSPLLLLPLLLQLLLVWLQLISSDRIRADLDTPW